MNKKTNVPLYYLSYPFFNREIDKMGEIDSKTKANGLSV
jgi:hypothetical protein